MNPLLSLWLQLTGGEQGCPRGRFALTLLAAYAAYHLLLPEFVHSLITLRLHGMTELSPLPCNLLLIAGGALALVGLLLAFLPLSPMALLGGSQTFHELYELLQGNAAGTAAPELLWPSWLGLILGAPALLLAGAVALGAAWRRLKDAGRSPLFLLLGATYLLGFDYNGSYAAEAAGLYLLGPLWLIILYSGASRSGQGFVLFRTLPARAKRSAPTTQTEQGARRKGEESSRSRVTSSQPSPGRNRNSAGTRPSPRNGARSSRRKMQERARAARRRN